jgi:hypothetical protein
MSDHANRTLKARKIFLYFVISFSGAIDEEGRLEESGAAFTSALILRRYQLLEPDHLIRGFLQLTAMVV